MRVQKELIGRGRPVVITGAMAGWPAFERWTKHRLVELHGDVELMTGAIPYASTFGLKPEVLRLSTVVEEHMGERAAELIAANRHYDLQYVFDPRLWRNESTADVLNKAVAFAGGNTVICCALRSSTSRA